MFPVFLDNVLDTSIQVPNYLYAIILMARSVLFC